MKMVLWVDHCGVNDGLGSIADCVRFVSFLTLRYAIFGYADQKGLCVTVSKGWEPCVISGLNGQTI